MCLPVIVYQIDADGIRSPLPVAIGMGHIARIVIGVGNTITPIDNIGCHLIITGIGHSTQAKVIDRTLINTVGTIQRDGGWYVVHYYFSFFVIIAAIVIGQHQADSILAIVREPVVFTEKSHA
ncbi:hypothetical protein ES703_120901 [subsurface metagenome]